MGSFGFGSYSWIRIRELFFEGIEKLNVPHSRAQNPIKGDRDPFSNHNPFSSMYSVEYLFYFFETRKSGRSVRHYSFSAVYKLAFPKTSTVSLQTSIPPTS